MDTETHANAMKQAFLLACDEECTCVPTPEYAEYERKQQEELGDITDIGERMLRVIFYPFFSELYPDTEEFVSVCLRCRILGVAEDSLDEYEVDSWRAEHQEKYPNNVSERISRSPWWSGDE